MGAGRIAAILALAMAAPVLAQDIVSPVRMLSVAEAVAQDAADYAARHAVPFEEAMRRLRVQEATVAATDGIAQTYRDRLAGIAIDHEPAYRIVVLLTGDEPVADMELAVAGTTVPVVFHTGARATRDRILAAITAHQAEIRAMLSQPPGMGVDPRTGTLVVMVGQRDIDHSLPGELQDRWEALTGVPVRVTARDRLLVDLAVEGGARIVGTDPADGRRYACTTGFAVTDGVRTGIATAAHCPDRPNYVVAGQPAVPLDFVGQWGHAFQDVQVNVAPASSTAVFDAAFYADTAKTALRPVTTWRNRPSTRAGDVVCHRGERTGYSCAEVALVDFAPAGDLCDGPCTPTWVAVEGPGCRGGDSGGPVFAGTVAFGILKGGSYRADGSCAFYYYMSTDYLPEGWSLLHR